MNQQEIDRLFDRHSFTDADYWKDGLIMRENFTAALQEATAQARREALEEVAKRIHTRLYEYAQDPDIDTSIAEQSRFLEAESIAEMINEMLEAALAAQPQEGK